MRQALAFLITVLFTVMAAEAQTKNSESHQSIRYSCLNKPFLSVSAYTAHHASFPDVELRLVDPLGRSSGKGSEGKRIPKTQYGRVIEVPSAPSGSKAVAVELCEAMQGDYIAIVSEHGNEKYGFTVRADDGGTGNEAIGSVFDSRRDRTCKFQFRFLMKDHSVTLSWLRDNVPIASPDPVCEIAN